MYERASYRDIDKAKNPKQGKAKTKGSTKFFNYRIFWRLDEWPFYGPSFNIGIYQKSLGYRLPDVSVGPKNPKI